MYVCGSNRLFGCRFSLLLFGGFFGFSHALFFGLFHFFDVVFKQVVDCGALACAVYSDLGSIRYTSQQNRGGKQTHHQTRGTAKMAPDEYKNVPKADIGLFELGEELVEFIGYGLSTELVHFLDIVQ